MLMDSMGEPAFRGACKFPQEVTLHRVLLVESHDEVVGGGRHEDSHLHNLVTNSKW